MKTNRKQNSIATFIGSLPMEAGMGNCESVLLSTNMEFMGGNGGNCINELYKKCHNATNGGDCLNYNSACDKSRNRGSCMTTTKERPQKPETLSGLG